MESEIPLNTLLDFLKLCEASGYIKFRLPFLQIQENIKSIWDAMSGRRQCDVSPDLSESDIPPLQDSFTAPKDERHLTTQTTCGNNESLSSIETYSFLDIKTPEVASTPLSVATQNTHASPSLSNINENHSNLSVMDRISVMEEEVKEVNNGSFISEECFGRCEVKTPLSSRCDQRETSQIPLFDLDSKNDDSDLHQSEPYVGVDDERHNMRTHTDWCNAERNITESHYGNYGDGNIEVELKKSCDKHVTISDSSDDESGDDKLEKLFSDMKLQSAKKNAHKHILSRKRLSVFIVSDSEENEATFSDEEVPKENIPPQSQLLVSSTTPTYSTPYTPYSGVVFWGSPDYINTDSKTHHTDKKTTQKPPFRERNFFTPLGDSKLNKRVSVTTPSAGKSFGRFKNSMIQELYTLFNSTVFNNNLPTDMPIIWNKKLRTTAGYCCYLGFGSARTARIELSTKVIDSYGRVRDTLLHEMCHAATWIIDGIKNGGHGVEWRKWAERAQAVHPGLKQVQRCHHYEIQYRHTYKCTVCDFKIGRHSKSVNLRTARCPYCLSTLELLPKLKSDGTPMLERKMNRYARFVKDHYSDVKSGSPWRSHKQVMEKIRDLYYSKQKVDYQPEVGGAY